MTQKETMQEPTDKSYTKMTAEIYDALYAAKDYEGEAKILTGLIGKYGQTNGNDLLDVACGTGAHLPFLKDKFKITGVDLSEEQLVAARKRLPGLEFLNGDMRSFDLHRQFDAVTCLFSSIGYVHPLPEMEKAVGNMAHHLKPGGVLIIEPWLQPGVFDPKRPPHTEHGESADGSLKVTRTMHNGLEGNVSIMNAHVGAEGSEGTQEFTEEHRLALYYPDEYQQAIEAAGLSFVHLEDGLSAERGLYIGTKPVAE